MPIQSDGSTNAEPYMEICGGQPQNPGQECDGENSHIQHRGWDDSRNRITSLGGPRKTIVAAVMIKVHSTAVKGSRWAVWGRAGVPDLDTSCASLFTHKGKRP